MGLILDQGKQKSVRNSRKFEMSELKINVVNWGEKQWQIQGKWVLVRNSGGFKITEFKIPRFNCTSFTSVSVIKKKNCL